MFDSHLPTVVKPVVGVVNKKIIAVGYCTTAIDDLTVKIIAGSGNDRSRDKVPFAQISVTDSQVEVVLVTKITVIAVDKHKIFAVCFKNIDMPWVEICRGVYGNRYSGIFIPMYAVRREVDLNDMLMGINTAFTVVVVTCVDFYIEHKISVKGVNDSGRDYKIIFVV